MELEFQDFFRPCEEQQGGFWRRDKILLLCNMFTKPLGLFPEFSRTLFILFVMLEQIPHQKNQNYLFAFYIVRERNFNDTHENVKLCNAVIMNVMSWFVYFF